MNEVTKLTGRTRYRTGREGFLFNRREVIVLQVEEQVLVTSNIGNQIEVETVLVWRDARITDISMAVGTEHG